MLPQEPGQILAVQQLHDNEHPPVMLTYVEDVGDPRMTEPGRTLRFPAELSRFVWVRSSGQQYLDCNLTVDAQVAAAPYLARSTAAQQAFKAVPARQLGPGLHETRPLPSRRTGRSRAQRHRNADGMGIRTPSISLRYRMAVENYAIP
jgi:hypothetical protein